VVIKKLNVVSVASSLAIIVTVMVYLLPAAFLSGGLSVSAIGLPPLAWLAVLYMGIPCGTLALALYFKGFESLNPTGSATLLLVQLLVGLALASTLLNENLSLAELTGASLILVAVAVSSKS